MTTSDDDKPPSSAAALSLEQIQKSLETEKRSLARTAGQRNKRAKKDGADLSSMESLENLDKADEERALPLPKERLTKKQAMDWAEEQLDLHTPLAVQVVVGRLKNGTREERYNTAQQILKGRGLYGESAGRVGLGPVLLISGLDPNHLPWGGIVKGRPVKTIEGVAVKAPPETEPDKT